MDDGRSMRAVKDSLPAPYGEGEESKRPRSMGAVEPTAGILPIESGKKIAEAAWRNEVIALHDEIPITRLTTS
jgi:hypothetical protein